EIEPVHYEGVVWCLTVPTGAFVVRRNGKVFVTGNSGFPKSHDVGKAIDKAAGAEREVVGVNETLRKYMPNGTTGSFQLGGCQSVAELEHLAEIGGKTPNGEDARKVLARRNDNEARFAITAPATPDAAEWSGWGTALKPAVEPIVAARKPFKGTVAANVLEHGTGAINIDACRIEAHGEKLGRPIQQGGSMRFDGFSTLEELRKAA